jgi:hypothetical protein
MEVPPVPDIGAGGTSVYTRSRNLCMACEIISQTNIYIYKIATPPNVKLKKERR